MIPRVMPSLYQMNSKWRGKGEKKKNTHIEPEHIFAYLPSSKIIDNGGQYPLKAKSSGSPSHNNKLLSCKEQEERLL